MNCALYFGLGAILGLGAGTSGRTILRGIMRGGMAVGEQTQKLASAVGQQTKKLSSGVVNHLKEIAAEAKAGL